MNEKVMEVVERYQTLKEREKLVFLSLLIHEVTIATRLAYSETNSVSTEAHAVFRSANEALNVISKQMLKELAFPGEGVGYPDDALFTVLLERMEGYSSDSRRFFQLVYSTFRELYRSFPHLKEESD